MTKSTLVKRKVIFKILFEIKRYLINLKFVATWSRSENFFNSGLMLCLWHVQKQVNVERQNNQTLLLCYKIGMQLHVLEVDTHDGYWDMKWVLNVISACMTVTYSAMAMNELPTCSDADYWVISIRVSPILDFGQCSLRIFPVKTKAKPL